MQKTSEWRNTATSKYRKQINKYDQKQTYWIWSKTAREIYTNKKPHILPDSNEYLQKWSRNTSSIAGASMRKEDFQNGIERSLPWSYNRLHVRLYQAIVKKWPDNIILDVGSHRSKVVLGKLLDLKKFQKQPPEVFCKKRCF